MRFVPAFFSRRSFNVNIFREEIGIFLCFASILCFLSVPPLPWFCFSPLELFYICCLSSSLSRHPSSPGPGRRNAFHFARLCSFANQPCGPVGPPTKIDLRGSMLDLDGDPLITDSDESPILPPCELIAALSAYLHCDFSWSPPDNATAGRGKYSGLPISAACLYQDYSYSCNPVGTRLGLTISSRAARMEGCTYSIQNLMCTLKIIL